MFDQIVQTITDYPYVGIALVFLLCGLGFPLPEEIVLLAGGFICAKYPDKAALLPMMGWCAGAILTGDMIPFVLGRIFGVRLLRLRWLRYFITKRRLATFDHWFRRRGDMVIVISRFLAGLRVVAFFTAGAMKMRWLRFLLLDGLGIALMVPLLTWIGFRSAGFIEEAIATVEKVERGLLWGVVAGAVLLGLWFWWWRNRRQKQKRQAVTEAFVQPKRPVQDQPLQGPGLPQQPAGDTPPAPGASDASPPTAAPGAPPAGSGRPERPGPNDDASEPQPPSGP